MPPTGSKRSRALWDRSRSEEGSWKALIRATLYEFQPIRYSELVLYIDAIFSSSRNIKSRLQYLLRETLPSLFHYVVLSVRGMTFRSWMGFAGVLLYYCFIRWIHEVLEAGPIVLILTALVAIFTVGLSDEDSDGLSAYSVFNKGFQKLMGSVDADALLQQHVGGGILFAAGNVQHHGAEEVDEIPARARRNRQAFPPPAAAEDQEAHENAAEEQRPNNNNRARRSGKKARRQNLEQRQEIRRQRDAAAAMGFGNGEADVVTMNRLLEDQVAE